MRSFLLVGHGGFHNRGCEAIVRTTVALLRERFGDARIVLSSRSYEMDSVHEAASDLNVIPDTGLWRPLSKALGRLARWRWVPRMMLSRLRFRCVDRALDEADAVLSIGGDNLTMAPGFPWMWLDLHDFVCERRRPLILWGASVGPFPPGPLEDCAMASLRRTDLITVREPATEEYLRARGVVENTRRVADPAFLLPVEEVDTRAFWPEGDGVLALNVSPYLARVNPRGEGALAAAADVIRWAVARGLGVLLVPHVLGSSMNDAQCMQELTQLNGGSNRIRAMPTDLNACETKYVISRCRFLVAARMHATIAGYSTGVPTISLAYSQKACGMNRDVYGHEKWLADWRSPEARDQLAIALRGLEEREDEVRRTLLEGAPMMCQRARLGVAHLAQLL